MNILITGAVSLSNKGTAAIVISTVENLKRTFPGSKITIELFYPEKQKHIINMQKEYRINVVSPLVQNPLKAILLFLMVILTLPARILGVKPNFKLLKNYENADVVVDISAEAFIRFYEEKFKGTAMRFLLHLYPLLICLFIGKKTVLLAQTLAPFGIFRYIMRYIIKNASLVTVRDSTSINNLMKEKVNTLKIHQCADPAFLLDTAPNKTVFNILKSEGINLNTMKNKKIVGICIGNILNSEKHKKIVKTLATVTEILIKEHNTAVVFIPHSSGKITRISNDVPIGLELKKHADIEKDYYVIRGDYSPQELKGIISKFDFLLSLRMHPVISALSIGIPVVIIAFNDKAYGLMKMFSLNNYVMDANNVKKDQLIKIIIKALDESPQIKKILKEKIHPVKQKALLNFKLLEEIMHENK